MNEQLIVGLALLALLYVLVKEVVAPSVAFLGATTAMLVLGVISSEQAFVGFSSPTIFTIGALFVIAAVFQKLIKIDKVLEKLVGSGKVSPLSYARLLLPISSVSGFLNNTPIVAMLINPVSKLAKRAKISPSKLLLPLSYAAILGGILTVIGTSTNLLVSGLMEESGLNPLGFFEITSIGLPIAVLGLIYLIFMSYKFLPDRKEVFALAENQIKKMTIEMVPKEENYNKTIKQAGLRDLDGAYLAAIRRKNGDLISPVAPNTLIKEGDQLLFAGSTKDIMDLENDEKLTHAHEEHVSKLAFDKEAYYEVVLGRSSPLVGKTLKNFGFRSKYQAVVLAIHRGVESLSGKLGSIKLEPGDSLLIIADEEFQERWKNFHDFLLIQEIGNKGTGSGDKLYTLGALVSVAALAEFILNPPFVASVLLLVILFIAFGLITAKEAYGAVDFELLILIASAIGFAQAVQSSGLARTISQTVQTWVDGGGTMLALFGVILITLLLTELVTNTAAASLVFPIAISVAEANGSDPRAFAVAVAITASLSFLSPFGYQTNTMVYGPGGYKFMDYVRFGFPLTVISVTATLYLVSQMYNI